MDKDNANPTILTASQLPTRQQKKHAAQNGFDAELMGSIVCRPSYLSGPFCDVPWLDDEESDEDLSDEPIDEQEIYGEHSLRFCPSASLAPPASRTTPGGRVASVAVTPHGDLIDCEVNCEADRCGTFHLMDS